MKRLAILSFVLCALVLISAPKWLAKGISNEYVYSWSADVNNGAVVSALYCVPGENGDAVTYRYSADRALAAAGELATEVASLFSAPDGNGDAVTYRYSADGSLTDAAGLTGVPSAALTVKALPGIADALIEYMAQNRGDKEYTLSYVLPQYIFAGDISAPNALAYSLKTGKLTPVGGEYAGSKEYGAVTVFAISGTFQVYIDD